MCRVLRLVMVVCIATVSPLGPILAQDDDLPYNPFIDKQIESQRSYENHAVRDLGGAQMNMVVGVPSEVKNDIQVTKKIPSKGEKPIVILVYGRKEVIPQQTDVAEELQRKEIERQAFKDGLREARIEVRGELQRQNQPEVVQPQ